MPALALRPARPDDVPAITALLEALKLPPEELERHLGNVVVAEEDGRIVGCGGLETYPGATAGLVRSMAVQAPRQATGLGDEIMRWLLDRAETVGLRELYLFTITAGGFYRRYGFRPVSLDDVPEALRGSWQYRAVRDQGHRWPGLVTMRRPVTAHERPT